MNQACALSAAGIRVQFDGVVALNLDRLEIPATGTVGALLMGPNGAGKTTFLDAVSGFVKPGNGASLRLHAGEAVDITHASKVRRVRTGLARTFQHPPVFASLTVQETIRMALSCSSGAQAHLFDGLVEVVGIKQILSISTALLPLHMLRRVELVRALATQPCLLMLDEPTAGSDDRERNHLAELLNVKIPEIVAQFHTAGLYRFSHLTSCVVTHDLKFARRLTEARTPNPIVHVLAQGQLRASGALMDLIEDAELRSSYFGGN